MTDPINDVLSKNSAFLATKNELYQVKQQLMFGIIDNILPLPLWDRVPKISGTVPAYTAHTSTVPQGGRIMHSSPRNGHPVQFVKGAPAQITEVSRPVQ